MSASTKATMPKPKRPLSGYNLFYRYKRHKVLEATARPNGRDGDNKAVIRAVLSALPGLEGVSPTSPLFRLCAVPVDEFRAATIRKAMEGKLFPNENARKRVHCKVHGMGFVEMGRMMRQTWGRADKLTKDVFCELAEVGRARYRMLVAEYKLSIERAENVKTVYETSLRRWREAQAASFTARQAPSPSDPMLEARSIWATKNPRPPAASASSESRNGAGASADLRFRGPVTSDGLSQGRRTSAIADLDRCDAPLFEPLPVERAARYVAISASEPPTATTGGNAAGSEVGHSHGRRASAKISALCNGGSGAGGGVDAPAAFATDNGGADSDSDSDSADADLEALKKDLDLQQSLLRKSIKKIQSQIIQNNSLLPTDMRVFLKEDVIPQDRVIGEKAHLGIRTLSGSSVLTGNGAVSNSDAPGSGSGGGGGNDPKKGEASTRDFMEFVDDLAELMDKMDEANEDHTIKPAFDMPIPDSISVPADIKLKNSWAHVA